MSDLEKLRFLEGGNHVFCAGLPHFPRNFSRDSIISSILMNDLEMLRNQLAFSSSLQGMKSDSVTGEEEGKIFHEFPGYVVSGLKTTFNACDTTALFLMGHGIYFDETGDFEFIESQRHFIEKAIEYLLNHIDNGVFIEDPSFSGAEEYALKVTYWKDSEIISRKDGKPKYPVSYTLVNAQVICALRAVNSFFENKYSNVIDEMLTKLKEDFFDDDKGFCLARDAEGKIFGNNSDFLHMLFYLEVGDLEEKHVDSILKMAESLETNFGYRSLPKSDEGLVSDTYHSKTVWPFEQALINIGAKNFGLSRIKEVSSRVFDNISESSPEIFIEKEGEWVSGGCDPQLWTIAAKKYFSDVLSVGV